MRRWKAHRGKIASLSFSRDGRLLASVTGSGRDVFIWSAMTGELVRKLTVKDVEGKAGYIEAHGVAFAPDADLLAVSRYQWIEVWSTAEWHRFAETELHYHHGIPYEIAVGPGATPLIATSSASHASVWKLPKTGSDLGAVAHWSVDHSAHVGFSATSTGLATHTVRLVEVRNPTTGKLIRSHVHPDGNYGGPVRFSPDSSRLAFCYTKIIESHPATLDNPDDVIRYAGHTNKVWVLRYTPDGKSLISASSDGTVRVWEAATGLQTQCFDMNVGKLAAADVSPDGTVAAVGGATGEIVVWDVE